MRSGIGSRRHNRDVFQVKAGREEPGGADCEEVETGECDTF